MNAIETVLINWKRPANVERIIQALREQTVPCTITLCDCHPSEKFALAESVKQMADRIYRCEHNMGSYNRYLPVAGLDHPYTFFIDDDLLPGSCCLEAFLDAALQLEDRFGVLGQFGRIISPEGYYIPKNIPLTGDFKEVDFIVQAYFVRTSNLHHLIQFRWDIGYFEDKLPEDDLLLCASLKYYMDYRCYLIPWDGNNEKLLKDNVLAADNSLSGRPDHYYKRQQFINRIVYYGWQSLTSTGEKKL